jgi:hypothetical protein
MKSDFRFILVAICSLISFSIPAEGNSRNQLYLIYDQTMNFVVGHDTRNYRSGYNFNTGFGFRHFVMKQYSIGAELYFSRMGLQEKREFPLQGGLRLLYSNEVDFYRIVFPVMLQVHQPRWYYGIGAGGSFLFHSGQVETITLVEKQESEWIDAHSFPSIELFMKFSGGFRLLPWLELNMHYYQGINDIGLNYSWQKNALLGAGVRFFFNRPPQIQTRPLFTPGRTQFQGRGFNVLDVNNIIRHSFRKVGDHPNKVTFRLTPIGSGSMGSNRIVSIDLDATSGEPVVSGSNTEILRATFPLEGIIRFVAYDVYYHSTFECVFRFEITDPGHWEIFLQY